MTTGSPRWWRWLIALVLAIAPVEAAEADRMTVNCPNDFCTAFVCGLYDAIVNHNNQDQEGSPSCPRGTADDEVVFDIGSTDAFFNGPLPAIKNKLKISGAGHTLHNAYLEVASGATLTLSQVGFAAEVGTPHPLSFIFVNPGGTLNLIGGSYSNAGALARQSQPEIGAVIYNKGGVVTIAPVDLVPCNSVPKGCPTFSHNTATRAGGVIHNEGGEVHIVGMNRFGGDPTRLTQNTAPDGGAIYNDGGKVFITAGAQVGGDQAGNQAQRGGGVYSTNGGVVIVTDSDVWGNEATSTDPLTGGGGIFANGTPVTIQHAQVLGNRAGYEGGGVFVQDAALTVRDTTFTENVAGNPSQKPGLGGAIFVNTQKTSQSVSVAGSTFFQNQAAESGSMIFYETGTGVLEITNSTLAGIPDVPQFGDQFAVILYGGTGRVAFSTLQNSGLIPAVGQRGRASIHMRGTILSGAVCTTGANGMVDAGHNLQWPGQNCPASIPVLDPRLAPGPQDNGGPTRTIAPTSGSPAIAAIPVAECTDHDGTRVTTDQRGFARPAGGDRCAIGAVETGAGVAATRTTLTVFKDAVKGGDILTFGVDASIAAGEGSLELHVGVLYPDRDTLVLLNQDGGVERYISLGAPAPPVPVAVLAGGETLHRPAFGRFEIPVTGLPAGTYQLFAVLARAGALDDAHIAPGEIVATDVRPIVYTP